VAEAFGVSAGVITVFDAGLRIHKALLELFRDISNAKEDIDEIADSLNVTNELVRLWTIHIDRYSNHSNPDMSARAEHLAAHLSDPKSRSVIAFSRDY
jgi:hypothetical protein